LTATFATNLFRLSVSFSALASFASGDRQVDLHLVDQRLGNFRMPSGQFGYRLLGSFLAFSALSPVAFSSISEMTAALGSTVALEHLRRQEPCAGA
jgi:hypothetical protein